MVARSEDTFSQWFVEREAKGKGAHGGNTTNHSKDAKKPPQCLWEQSNITKYASFGIEIGYGDISLTNISKNMGGSRTISTLLTSQVFLSIIHRFSNKAYDNLADSSDPSKPPPSIQIVQSEIFDIIQSKRYHILKYMKENPDDADAATEAAVRVATGTGTRAERSDKNELKPRPYAHT